jgi:hypothetical protein
MDDTLWREGGRKASNTNKEREQAYANESAGED